MKIKLNTKGDSQPPTPSSELPPTPGGGPKIKLKVGSLSSPSQVSLPPPPPTSVDPEVPKPKRKYTKRKDKDEKGDTPEKVKPGRKRKAKEIDEGGDDEKSLKKRTGSAASGTSTTIKIRVPSSSTGIPVPIPPQSIKLKLAAKQRISSVPNIRIKAKGKPPERKHGVGYDSEQEDLEEDPAIESQFILRMMPGEDCDYLRDAIENKRIGLPLSEGGAEVSMRFFDKEGRRGVVNIRGHLYAASMLDMPCVIESMKSWDRKGWYKTADICQMLLVTQRVQNEEEAKSASLPREVNMLNWEYPHGLTPPMHYVRKRRFRKRLNFRTIEAVEDEVARLIAADEKVVEEGGVSEFQLMDFEQFLRESEQADEDDAVGEEDAYGEVIPGYEAGMGEDGDAEGEPDDEMIALMQQELERDGDGAADDDAPTILHSAGPMRTSPDSMLPPGMTPDSRTPGNSRGSSPEESTAPTDGATVAAAKASTTSTSSDSEDDDAAGADDDDAAPIDEDEILRQRELAQQREELEDLKKELEDAERTMNRQTNPLLKQRAAGRVKSLKADLQLKLASLGEDGE